jgi:tetratricopeptide (TPR) repeat protein
LGLGWGGIGLGWGGYYPYGGLSVGYHSRHFGFLYGTGGGYGYPWPYYDYDPCCVYYPGGATYSITDSQPYAYAPRAAASISTDGIVSDATAAAIPSNTQPERLNPTPVASTNPDPAAADSARDFARDGEISFKKGDYKQAMREWRHALLEDPQNGTLVMMMAQAQFQTGDFNQAAGAVQAGMMMLSKDKWGVVVGNFKELYSETQDYVDQVKVLEKAIKDEPKNPALRFLVGFHYLYLGYPAEAIRELKAGEEEAKTDQSMKELIKVAEEMTQKKSGEIAPPPPAEAPKKPDGQ